MERPRPGKQVAIVGKSRVMKLALLLAALLAAASASAYAAVLLLLPKECNPFG
jgi:hypothetical protein